MDIFEKALAFAIKAHEGQIRKSGNTPYILHPAEAASIAATMTDDREILAAVALHDTVEDSDATVDMIKAEFGERIAQLVKGETEAPYPEMSRSESWKLRKTESIEYLRNADDKGVKIMWLADKLSNLRSFGHMYYRMGDEMWQRFNQKDKREHEWYYRLIAQELSELSETYAYQEYIFLVDHIFGGSHES